MSISETCTEQFADSGDRVLVAVILHGLPGFIMKLQRQTSSPFSFEDTRSYFLQMLLSTLIITKRKLYKCIGREAFAQLVKEIFDGIRHDI